MRTKTQALAIMTLGATLAIASAQTTQTTAKAAPAPATPALSRTEQAIKDIKKPAPGLSWGADFRARNEYFNNAQTLTPDSALNPRAPLHEQDYFRFRTRVWSTIKPVEDVSLNTRLAAEPREWMKPSSSGNNRGTVASGQTGNSGFEGRYGIVDNLNVVWNKPLDLPATLTVGRQDIFPGTPGGLGTGWLVADGTPLDGSWTFFFDAARLKYNVEELKTTVDLIGLLQYNEPDKWLPTIGASSHAGEPAAYGLTDQNEQGVVLWLNNKSVPEVNVDGYFIYKHDTRISSAGPPPSGKNGIGGSFGDDADIYTVGGRLSGLIEEHWKYSMEGAYQFGRKRDPQVRNGLSPNAVTTGSRTMNAFGFNSRLTYLFNDKLKNQVYLTYEFLTGDDPDTTDDEMFDILWGRWPQWSELYIPYSYIPEARTGQMANYHRFGPGWACSPTKKMDVSLNYNLLYAAEDTPTRASAPNAFGSNPSNNFSNGDSFRGHYLQAILKYKFSQHVSGHLWGEFVFPGHYYEDVGVTMTFLRAELMFTF